MFDLELLITDGAPQVLFPEVGQGSVYASNLHAMVRLGTFFGQRPQHRLAAAVVQGDTSQHSLGKLLLNSGRWYRLGAHGAPAPAVVHAKIIIPGALGEDTVVGLIATVTDQDPGQGIDSLFSSSRTGLPRLVTLSPYFLAPEPELLDLLWHLVSPVDDLFIGPTSVIDHLTLIESIVEKGADGAFSEGPTITGGVALGVQLLGQGPEGMLS